MSRKVFICSCLPVGKDGVVYKKQAVQNVFDFLKRRFMLGETVYLDAGVFLDLFSKLLFSKDSKIKIVSPEEIKAMATDEDRFFILIEDSLYEFVRER